MAALERCAEAPPRIGGEGTSERTWQRWQADWPCRDLDIAHVLPPHQRLVVVAPHPDDEVLACGGLVAMHAAQGSEVVVIGVTDGERSHEDVDLPGPAELAQRRSGERLQGLGRLGIAQPEVHTLALADGQVQASVGQLMGWLASFLSPGDVVVSTWEHDGHPDHDTTGRATRDICQGIGCRYLAAPVWMWHWAGMADPRVPWERLHRVTLNADARARKQAALTSHVTQITPRSTTLGPVLGATARARAAWDHEYFFV